MRTASKSFRSDTGSVAAKVLAQIQAVGSTSTTSNTWLWGWANESLPTSVTARICEVRDFGNSEALAKLTEPKLPDQEYLGWELTAIAAQIIGAKGAYRCPGERGFLYLLYTDLAFANSSGVPSESTTAEREGINCETHGSGQKAFICQHLLLDPRQEWFSDLPSPTKPWPDAWCSECNKFYQAQGEWNDENEDQIEIKLICNRCYESLRTNATRDKPS